MNSTVFILANKIFFNRIQNFFGQLNTLKFKKIKHFYSTTYSSKLLTNIKQMFIINLFGKCYHLPSLRAKETWSTERLSDVFYVIQLIDGEARSRGQVVWYRVMPTLPCGCSNIISSNKWFNTFSFFHFTTKTDMWSMGGRLRECYLI